MPTATPPRATPQDLARVEGKAELIGGKVVRFMASGYLPSLAASNIAISLREYRRSTGVGIAAPDGLGYIVPELSSGRESFEPDASYCNQPPPANRMGFIQGPPTFAVEVRSENDYTPRADREYEAKRADYFEAGTLCVWDVDPHAGTVTKFLPPDAVNGVMIRLGGSADAEPAVPGWSMSVADIFRE